MLCSLPGNPAQRPIPEQGNNGVTLEGAACHTSGFHRGAAEKELALGGKNKNRSVLCAPFLKETFLPDLAMVSTDKILVFELLRKGEAGDCFQELFPS